MWGRELDLTGNLLGADNVDIPCPIGVFLGILDGVASSKRKYVKIIIIHVVLRKKCLPVLSSDKFDPCLDGGLLPGRLPVLEAGLELFLDPPGDMGVRYDGFLGVLKEALSLSDNESGVPADNEDFDALG